VVDPDDIAVPLCDAMNEALVVREVGGGALITPLLTHETGASRSFTVALSQPPAFPVTIIVSATDTDEVTIGSSMLTFTADDFATPKLVTITGHGDGLVDGTASFFLELDPASEDDGYDRLPTTTIAAQNVAGTIDLALGKPVVVTCRPGSATCPGTDVPGELNDGLAATAYAFTDGFGTAAICGTPFPTACSPKPAAPTIVVDLGSAIEGLELLVSCTPTTQVFTIPVPTLSVSADGTITVPASTRFVRLTSSVFSVSGLDVWAAGVDCAVLSATANGDL
jgi:hypothetical protein